MRAVETKVLGAEHAAEHARLRAYERSPYWRRRRAARPPREGARTGRVRLAAADALDRTGRWTDQFDIPVFAINSIVLPTGKVLWFAYPNNPDSRGAARATRPTRGCGTPPKGTGATRSSRSTRRSTLPPASR